ncbi:MAG: c-type cytochrome, partial [Verrucomicrobiota bacterium]
ICSSFPAGKSETGTAELSDALEKNIFAPDARVQLEALMGFSNPQLLPFVRTPELVDSILQAYSAFNDPWRKSAVVALALKSETAFFPAAFRMKQIDSAKELLTLLTQQRAATVDLTRGLAFVASQPAAVDELKRAVLETLVKNLGSLATPTWSPNLQSAFQSFLASQNSGVTAAVLPLIARWDKTGAMKSDVQSLTQKLLAKLNDPHQSDEQRAQAATGLVSIRQLDAEIVPSLGNALRGNSSPALQKRIVELLGTVPEAGNELVSAYPKFSADLQLQTFNQLIKRSDSSSALLDAIAAKKIDLATLGPLAVNRLRTHSDPAVAQRAAQVIDEIRGPQIKEKNDLIAKFTGVATQSGNAENGHQLFTVNCAVCHRFSGEGKDLAPDLTGMGAHGAAELLVHILDPNRVVEPNFISVSIETKDGETLDGIIAREGKADLVLRNAAGDVELSRKNIVSQKSTGRSLMPEGFEALGGEGLRDILTYICAGESRFRIVDLKSAFSANSTRGIYSSADSVEESLKFKKFGMIKAGDVPFEIANPATTVAGNNLIVLKGGSGVAQTMPQKVVAKNVNLKANKLHFLGGVAGWGWPWGDDKLKGLPVAKVTVTYAEGKADEFILKNGEEFADYNGNMAVPGSKEVPGVLQHGQVRWFTRTLSNPNPIKEIALESFNNDVSPTFVAITAEVGEGGKTDAVQTAAPKLEWGKHPRVLIVGGGASHDFNRWFNQADVAILSGKNSVNYTEDVSQIEPALKEIDVLYLSNNQPLTSGGRNAIMGFANSGKPLLLVHPALWYNWKEWPEYNRELVG